MPYDTWLELRSLWLEIRYLAMLAGAVGLLFLVLQLVWWGPAERRDRLRRAMLRTRSSGTGRE